MGGNPVACAIGTSVLEVIKKEDMLLSAKMVGSTLMDGLLLLKEKYIIVGDVRGMGLCLGVEIVCGRPNMKPATNLANRILFRCVTFYFVSILILMSSLFSHRMKEDKVIVSIQGEERNVINITPPMCFCFNNARQLLEAFDRALEKVSSNEDEIETPSSSRSVLGYASAIIS